MGEPSELNEAQIAFLREAVARVKGKDSKFLKIEDVGKAFAYTYEESNDIVAHLSDFQFFDSHSYGGDVQVTRSAERFIASVILKEDQENSIKLLEGIYNKGKGHPRRFLDASAIGSELGLTPEQVKRYVYDLARRNKISYPAHGSEPPLTVAIAALGKKEVEESKPVPTPPTGFKGWAIRVVGGSAEEIAKNLIRIGVAFLGGVIVTYCTRHNAPALSPPSSSSAIATQPASRPAR